MAGGVNGSSNSSYYLYTNQYYWSGSPYFFSNYGTFAYGFTVYSTGDVSTYFVNDSFGARPVINLSSEVKLSGNGTYSNPYTVS